MAGSDESGEDMQSGRVNRAEDHTRIWAQQNQGQPFNGDAIFIVEPARNIEDDDFVHASSKLHAIVGFGVSDGAGIVGVSSAEEGIPPVSNVGVFGKGSIGVGGEGSPGVEGVGAANPFHVLAGAGVMGRGGRRSAPPASDEKLHGPGVVGLGGSRSRDVADADKIAGNVGVFGQGADGEGARRAGAGVVGRGGAVDGTQFAPGVVGLTSTALDLDLGVMNPRDTGVFGLGGTGVTGQGSTGPGVRGVGGPAGATEINPDRLQAGVVGQGGLGLDPGNQGFLHGPGVVGLAGDLRALPYAEAGETGVYGAGQIGVKGIGSEGRGGVFASERSAQLQLLPVQRDRITERESFIPTVASEPDRPSLPRSGNGGDLMALTDDLGRCTLWFCVQGSGRTVLFARWAQVLLGPVFNGRD